MASQIMTRYPVAGRTTSRAMTAEYGSQHTHLPERPKKDEMREKTYRDPDTMECLQASRHCAKQVLGRRSGALASQAARDVGICVGAIHSINDSHLCLKVSAFCPRGSRPGTRRGSRWNCFKIKILTYTNKLHPGTKGIEERVAARGLAGKQPRDGTRRRA